MKKIFFLLVASLCMQGAFAQRHGIFIISYPIAFQWVISVIILVTQVFAVLT
jgi:hypothetical protein